MRKIVFIFIFLCFCFFYAGCNTPGTNANAAQMDSDATIGSMVQFVSPKSIPVEGVGLVTGLNGKGSSECLPEIRSYLVQYIRAELPQGSGVSADNLIDSLDTAVVVLEGILPVEDSSRPYFDLKVSALRGTQTISLENGWLYKSELKLQLNTFGINTETLAEAEGPIFIDQLSGPVSDKRTGYILAGGKIVAKYVIGLILKNPDFELTNNLRNRLNMRFNNSARAVQAGMIEVAVPEKYKEQRGKFIELIKAMYAYDVPQNDQERINRHIREMTENPQSDADEMALEAIGNQCLSQLSALLGSPDEHVRLRAARCMLNLRSDAGISVLRNIAMNKLSPYRIEAMKAITESGSSKDASSLCVALLKDDNFNIRLDAYEQLRKLNDISVVGRPIASNFFLEKIAQSDKKDIYVSRSDEPVIVLFGSPLYCKKGFTIRSANGEITIDAQADTDYVLVTRKYPNRNSLTGQIRCTYELGNIIQALCEQPPQRGQETMGGLGVSYCDMTALLKQLCDKGAVDANFHAGPLPKINIIVKK